jgi:hypothetical protein
MQNRTGNTKQQEREKKKSRDCVEIMRFLEV